MTEKQPKRDIYFDKLVTTFFDNLWKSNSYLNFMSKNLDMIFETRKNWNKNMENILALLQLPNQNMQQKILHQLNTLLTEYRFENDELKYRMEKLEKEIHLVKNNSELSKVEGN